MYKSRVRLSLAILIALVTLLQQKTFCSDYVTKELDSIVVANIPSIEWRTSFSGILNELYSYGLTKHQTQKNLYDKRFIASTRQLILQWESDLQRAKEDNVLIDEAYRGITKDAAIRDLKPLLDQQLLTDSDLRQQDSYLMQYNVDCTRYLLNKLQSSHVILIDDDLNEKFGKIMQPPVDTKLFLGGLIASGEKDSDLLRSEHQRHYRNSMIMNYSYIYVKSFANLYKQEIKGTQGCLFYQQSEIMDEKILEDKLKIARLLIDQVVQKDRCSINKETSKLLRMVFVDNVVTKLDINNYKDTINNVGQQVEVDNVLNFKDKPYKYYTTVDRKTSKVEKDVIAQVGAIAKNEIPSEKMASIYSEVLHKVYDVGHAMYIDKQEKFDLRFIESSQRLLSRIGNNYREAKKRGLEIDSIEKDATDNREIRINEMVTELTNNMTTSKLMSNEDILDQLAYSRQYFSTCRQHLLQNMMSCNYIALQNFSIDQRVELKRSTNKFREYIIADYNEELNGRGDLASLTRYHLPLNSKSQGKPFADDIVDDIITREINAGAVTGYVCTQINLFMDIYEWQRENTLGDLFSPTIRIFDNEDLNKKIEAAKDIIDQSVEIMGEDRFFVVDRSQTNSQLALIAGNMRSKNFLIVNTGDRVIFDCAAYIGKPQ